MATRGRRSDGDHIADLYRQIYQVVRRIPRGRVATYGQIAELAGIPGGARVAGAAMRGCPPELSLPWHRVVGKRSRGMAKVSILDPVGGGIQRSMLEDEGVSFTAAGSIRLDDFGWLPRDDPRRRKRRNEQRRPGKGRRASND